MDVLILIISILTGVDPDLEAGSPTPPAGEEGDSVRKSPIG